MAAVYVSAGEVLHKTQAWAENAFFPPPPLSRFWFTLVMTHIALGSSTTTRGWTPAGSWTGWWWPTWAVPTCASASPATTGWAGRKETTCTLGTCWAAWIPWTSQNVGCFHNQRVGQESGFNNSVIQVWRKNEIIEIFRTSASVKLSKDQNYIFNIWRSPHTSTWLPNQHPPDINIQLGNQPSMKAERGSWQEQLTTITDRIIVFCFFIIVLILHVPHSKQVHCERVHGRHERKWNWCRRLPQHLWRVRWHR